MSPFLLFFACTPENVIRDLVPEMAISPAAPFDFGQGIDEHAAPFQFGAEHRAADGVEDHEFDAVDDLRRDGLVAQARYKIGDAPCVRIAGGRCVGHY